MEIMVYVLAAIGAWVVDDLCPSPPRPWPPGPWPWLRKILAVIGGIGAVILFHDLMPADSVNAVSIIIVSGVGGAFLASFVTMLAGDRMRTAAPSDMR